MSSNARLAQKIRKIALYNAVNHHGIAKADPVMGKLLAEEPDLKAQIRKVMITVREVVKEVNKLDPEEQKRYIEQNWPREHLQIKVEEVRVLPPLPNVEKYATIVTRFSPNPDAPLHLGSARAIILCHEYSKMYKGRFLVRFEDTDPKLKRPQIQFYDFIKHDLKWLKSEPDEYFIQSDRLPVYYEYAERLLRKGKAYVCSCKPEAFRHLITAGKSCPCRNLPLTEQLKRWQRMLDGTYGEREAVFRVKTSLRHPNPAVRDWPAFRIIDTETYPHPRVGKKYRVWPLYNLACGVDDHLMGITHIIRGKEHLTNQTRQEYMYRYFGWKYPEAIHYGRLKIEGASLSKSMILQGMREGIFSAWDDIRLATFAALRRRGIQPDAIAKLIIDVGPKTQDVTLSWENLYAHNRKIVEPKANRYFFVHNPTKVIVKEVPRTFRAEISLHPDYPERGHRKFTVTPESGIAKFWLATKDIERIGKGQIVRLMEMFNIRLVHLEGDIVEAIFHSENYEVAKKVKAPLIHWIPVEPTMKCQVMQADGSVADGIVEKSCRNLKPDTIVQFERFGFVRIDRNKKNEIIAYYCHR